jgi:hypothetical protein
MKLVTYFGSKPVVFKKAELHGARYLFRQYACSVIQSLIYVNEINIAYKPCHRRNGIFHALLSSMLKCNGLNIVQDVRRMNINTCHAGDSKILTSQKVPG